VETRRIGGIGVAAAMVSVGSMKAVSSAARLHIAARMPLALANAHKHLCAAARLPHRCSSRAAAHNALLMRALRAASWRDASWMVDRLLPRQRTRA